MDVGSADVIRLIQAHLLEAGLRGSVRALQEETGIKLPGQLSSSAAASSNDGAGGGGASNFFFHASSGSWGAVLESLSWVDLGGAPRGEELAAEVHEMAVLELAEAGDLALAYAAYRLARPLLEGSEVLVRVLPESRGDGEGGGGGDKPSLPATKMSRARLLEQKLAALAAAASLPGAAASGGAGSAPPPPRAQPKIPRDFYYSGDPADEAKQKKEGRGRRRTSSHYPTRQERREDLGRRLQDAVPCIPRQRLTCLLQQAVLWQSHTGQLPRVRRVWHDPSAESDDEHDGSSQTDREKEGASASGKRKPKKRLRKEFDLVLGTVQVDPVPSGAAYLDRSKLPVEPVARRPFSAVKFGKQARPESAAFLPSGSGLVTGSSDGLIEVWDASTNYSELMLSLAYQRDDELMGHDNQAGVTALAVSNDGQVLASGDASGRVKVWKIETGRCLRSWQAHGGGGSGPAPPSSSAASAVACIALAPDASRVLTASGGGGGGGGDGSCREFGLRTTRMLMDLSHPASVTWCGYCVTEAEDPGGGDGRLLIVTASGDGAVRIWDRASQEVLRMLRPVASVGVPMSSWSRQGGSVVVSAGGDASLSVGTRHDPSAAIGSPTVHTVLMLHTPPSTLIVVPRGPRAFLVDSAGTVVRVYDSERGSKSGGQGSCFVAAAVSCTNQWLYAVTESGTCCVFSVDSGELETAVRDFGEETMRLHKDSTSNAEVTSMLHHPNRSILAAFSTSKYQKKGQVVIWK
jgi:WD40 repeat-containing protein SMU1